jgi:hypothetical protein
MQISRDDAIVQTVALAGLAHRLLEGIEADPKPYKVKWTMANGRPSTMMQTFIDSTFLPIMKDVSASDKRTFVLALSHTDRIISKHFTLDAVQSGWEKAGLVDLSFHTMMSHYLDWRNMSLENIEGIQRLLPSFFHEMAETFVLSDQTMAMMQRYFPVDFKVYPTGRETLSISRKRAVIFSRWVQLMREKAAKFKVMDDAIVAARDEDAQPLNPKLDAKGKAVCPCAFNNFHGRHYDNTAEGWLEHKKSKAHQNWRASELEKSESEVGRQATTAAHTLPWFNQENCSELRFLLERLNASTVVGKSFVKAKMTDADIPMMMMMTDDRWMHDFGMQPGQVKEFKNTARTIATVDKYEPFEEAVWEQLHSWNRMIEQIQSRHMYPWMQDWTDEEAKERISDLRDRIRSSANFMSQEIATLRDLIDPLDWMEQYHGNEVELDPVNESGDDERPAEDDEEEKAVKKRRAKRLRAAQKFR